MNIRAENCKDDCTKSRVARKKPGVTMRAPPSHEPDILDSASSEDSIITFSEEE